MSLFRYILLIFTFFAYIGNSLTFDIDLFINNSDMYNDRRRLVVFETIDYAYPESEEHIYEEYGESGDANYPYANTDQPIVHENETEAPDSEYNSNDKESDQVINTDPAMGGAFGGIFGVLALIAALRHACFKKTMAEMENDANKPDNSAAPGAIEMEEIQVDGEINK